MKTKLYIFTLSVCTFLTTYLTAQVGVGTDLIHVNAMLQVDAAVDNTSASPSDTELLNDVIITKTGNLGIGTIDNAQKLHVKANRATLSRNTIENIYNLSGTTGARTDISIGASDTSGASKYLYLGVDKTASSSSVFPAFDTDFGSHEKSYIDNRSGSRLSFGNDNNELLTLFNNNVIIGMASTSNIGIGTPTPTRKLEISSDANPPMKINTTYSSAVNVASAKLLAVESDGDVVPSTVSIQSVVDEAISNLGIPRPAVFTLSADQPNFLDGVASGVGKVLPLTLASNYISNLSYNAGSKTITFGDAGLYLISLTYEGDTEFDTSSCTLSSYFVDFPTSSGDARVHSTASHQPGAPSNHGGVIQYVSSISAGQTWTIELGRGQSGNCNDGTKISRRTYLLIQKLN